MHLATIPIKAVMREETEYSGASVCQQQSYAICFNLGKKVRWHKKGGFTMVELVATMMIAGVLAAMAAPRFFNNNAFQSRGFYDQVISTLRYAQKAAIAQNRNVCATLTSSDITLTIASASGATSACNTQLVSPSTLQTPYKISAPSTTITLSALSFGFDALGKPFDAVGTPSTTNKTIIISGATNNITVEYETGYVH